MHGPTRFSGVCNLPTDQKISLQHNEKGQLIGVSAGLLGSFLRSIARNSSLHPLSYNDWINVSATLEDHVYDIAQGHMFIVFHFSCFNFCMT